MFQARIFSSARARFAATAATVFALVALGGVTAAPAYAVATLVLSVDDESTGGPFGDQDVTLTPLGGGASYSGRTFPDGTLTIGPMDPGNYIFNPDSTAYVHEDEILTIDDTTNFIIVNVDKYQVDGSVPAGAGSGNTTAVVQRDAGGGVWIDDTVTQTITATDDSFVLYVPEGPGTYRIQFQPAEASDYYTSYSDPFTVVSGSPLVSVGAVAFASAATITGNVVAYNLGAGLQGADVHAQVGGVDVGTAFTDVNGDFRIKLPQTDASYTVWVDHPDYDRQWNHYATQESYATPVTLDAGNGFAATGIDYLLNLDTSDLIVNVVDGSGAYAVDFTLYPFDSHTGKWSSFPSYISYEPSARLEYGNLPVGDYRLVLQHPTTGVVLPVDGGCYLEFSSVLVTDVEFTDALVDPTADAAACDDPAYLDPTDAAVTGTVTNITDLDYAVTAQLWSSGPFGALYPVDSSLVDPATGDYELNGLRDSWYYFIKFVTDDRDPYLDALLGSNGQSWDSDPSSAQYVIDNFPLPLDPADPSTLDDYDVTLQGAAVLPGSVLSGTTPVVGEVEVIDASDSSIVATQQLDADGDFLFKVPSGTDYILYVDSEDDQYINEYWDDATDVSAAEAIPTPDTGSYGPFDFDLEPAPAQLYVWVDDEQTYDEVIVHLYYWFDDAWQELEQQQTTFQQAYFTRNFDTLVDDGLEPGDYRVRFESALTPGLWLEATEFAIGQDASNGFYTEGTPPSCFVDFTGLTTGWASFVEATFDATNQDPAACGPQLPPAGDVSGHFEGSSAYPLEEVADHEMQLYNDDFTIYDDTDANGDFTILDVPSGTYSVDLYPTSHTVGTHDYTYYGPDVVLSGGDVDLGTLYATRYGNAFGQIDPADWDDATMGGATATVMKLVDGEWLAGPLAVEISSTGEFEVPGIDEDGSYGVLIEFPDTWSPIFIGGGILAPTTPFTGTAETDHDFGTVTLDLELLIPITGTVFFGSAPAVGTQVYARPIGTCFCLVFEAEVDVHGDYTIWVPPTLSYEVVAFSAITQVGVYNGLNYPIDYTGPYTPTPVVVGTTGAIGINFSLVANDEIYYTVVPLEVVTDDFITGVEVHFYKKVTGGWAEVYTEVANPYSIFTAPGEAQYRLRFSKSGDWLAIGEVLTDTAYPFAPVVDATEELDPAQCYYDLADVQHGSFVTAIASLYTDSSAYGCAAEPAVVSPPATPGTSGSGTKKPVTTTTTDVAELEEEPQPTATPTPTAEPSDTPDDGGAVDTPATTSAPDFSWAFWVSGVLALFVLAGGAVFFVRRRP